MRILCLVDCYLPSTKSSAKLVHDLAAEFVCLGHEAIVAAPDEFLKTSCEESCEDGIRVLRVRTDKIKGAGKIRRAINEIRLSSVMWKAGAEFFKKNPCDLIVFYSPSIFFAALVKKLKKLWACPSYLILRDIFPQWALDAGVLRKGLIYSYFRKKELQQYSVADIIGVQSPGNLTYFTENSLTTKSLDVLFNWTPLEENAKPPGLRRKLGLDGKVVFFYGGNIGLAQDMDNILRLASALSDEPDAYFLLVGTGSEVPRLEALIGEKGLTNIAIHPAVPQGEYLGLVGEFDVGLISLGRELKTHNFPGKMLGYMYHAMPILASINPGNDLQEVIEQSHSGLVSVNGEDSTLQENARKFLHDLQFRQVTGKNSRALLEKTFSVHHATGQILSHFQGATN